MRQPIDRPPAAEAGSELLVLQKWEDFVGWFFNHTHRWPKAARFTLTQRLENHALDITEMLVQARFEPRQRRSALHDINLRLERMRHLCRIALSSRVETKKGFESTLRQLDEVGRMVHGWRVAIGARPRGKQRAGARTGAAAGTATATGTTTGTGVGSGADMAAHTGADVSVGRATGTAEAVNR